MSISPCPVCSVIPALIETHFNHKYLLKGLRIFDINVEFKINCHHFTLQWLGRWESEFGMDIEKPENSWYNYTSAEQIKTWSPGLALTVTVTRFPDTITPKQSSPPITLPQAAPQNVQSVCVTIWIRSWSEDINVKINIIYQLFKYNSLLLAQYT